jgi:hypothetical protein
LRFLGAALVLLIASCRSTPQPLVPVFTVTREAPPTRAEHVTFSFQKLEIGWIDDRHATFVLAKIEGRVRVEGKRMTYVARRGDLLSDRPTRVEEPELLGKSFDVDGDKVLPAGDVSPAALDVASSELASFPRAMPFALRLGEEIPLAKLGMNGAWVMTHLARVEGTSGVFEVSEQGKNARMTGRFRVRPNGEVEEARLVEVVRSMDRGRPREVALVTSLARGGPDVAIPAGCGVCKDVTSPALLTEARLRSVACEASPLELTIGADGVVCEVKTTDRCLAGALGAAFLAAPLGTCGLLRLP